MDELTRLKAKTDVWHMKYQQRKINQEAERIFDELVEHGVDPKDVALRLLKIGYLGEAAEGHKIGEWFEAYIADIRALADYLENPTRK